MTWYYQKQKVKVGNLTTLNWDNRNNATRGNSENSRSKQTKGVLYNCTKDKGMITGLSYKNLKDGKDNSNQTSQNAVQLELQ